MDAPERTQDVLDQLVIVTALLADDEAEKGQVLTVLEACAAEIEKLRAERDALLREAEGERDAAFGALREIRDKPCSLSHDWKPAR